MNTQLILHIIIGFIGLILLAIPFSNNRKIINFKYIFTHTIIQVTNEKIQQNNLFLKG